jgi:hypothetical protein
MENKEIKLLDKLDDLSGNYDFEFESEMVPYRMPIDAKLFQRDATTILKEYSKDNALLFYKWVDCNTDHTEHGNLSYEELYNLFLEDQNK